MPGAPNSMRSHLHARAKNIYVRFAVINLGLGNYSFSPLRLRLVRILMRLLIFYTIFLIREYNMVASGVEINRLIGLCNIRSSAVHGSSG